MSHTARKFVILSAVPPLFGGTESKDAQSSLPENRVSECENDNKKIEKTQ